MAWTNIFSEGEKLLINRYGGYGLGMILVIQPKDDAEWTTLINSIDIVKAAEALNKSVEAYVNGIASANGYWLAGYTYSKNANEQYEYFYTNGNSWQTITSNTQIYDDPMAVIKNNGHYDEKDFNR